LLDGGGKLRQFRAGALRARRGVVGEAENLVDAASQVINRSRQHIGRLGHGFRVLTGGDDRLHRRTGFRAGVIGGFRHNLGVVAHGGDRFNELTGNMLHRAVEVLGQRRHFLPAFVRLQLFGLMTRLLHRLNFQFLVAKYLDRLDHLPNFIAAITIVQGHFGVAGRHLLHGVGDRCYRLEDRP
jgi:hypothetical protein